ncbi:hypothetical protein LAUMK13_03667 [Mycobacterium innocens]|uniref:Uncharacterized protein n=1 Tax=Mycobacterium innocens TaxID=2341083 RepID=A0A498Q8P5_9MYCO|nr:MULTISPECIES: hypothetical protein [Mycobacterium]VBA41681.1 hypothetical protein LAUMK13_03667 [Mycobacterium innocens]
MALPLGRPGDDVASVSRYVFDRRDEPIHMAHFRTPDSCIVRRYGLLLTSVWSECSQIFATRASLRVRNHIENFSLGQAISRGNSNLWI